MQSVANDKSNATLSILVFSASLRKELFNTQLAKLAKDN